MTDDRLLLGAMSMNVKAVLAAWGQWCLVDKEGSTYQGPVPQLEEFVNKNGLRILWWEQQLASGEFARCEPWKPRL